MPHSDDTLARKSRAVRLYFAAPPAFPLSSRQEMMPAIGLGRRQKALSRNHCGVGRRTLVRPYTYRLVLAGLGLGCRVHHTEPHGR